MEVKGTVRLQSNGAAGHDRLDTLAEVRSSPLHTILERTLTDSHNWYADMLTLTLALETSGSGRFADGVTVIPDFVTGLLPGTNGSEMSLWIQDD